MRKLDRIEYEIKQCEKKLLELNKKRGINAKIIYDDNKRILVGPYEDSYKLIRKRQKRLIREYMNTWTPS